MLCADFHAVFCLLKQKVLLVEINSFPKENSQFLLLKLLFRRFKPMVFVVETFGICLRN
mgnify:CR=1 FL=1